MKRILPGLLLAATLLCACGTAVPHSPGQSPAQTTAPTPDPTPEPVVIYDALYEAGNYSDELGNTWDYVFRIPAIQAPGSDATRLNQEMFTALYPYVKDGKDAMLNEVSLVVCRVDYTVFLNGELISILSEINTDWGFDVYYTVNYDAKTKTEVDRAALLARYGLTEEEFLTLAAQTVDTHFQQSFGNLEQDAFWQNRHDLSIAQDNFTTDCHLYVNDAGELCMIVRLYSFAGADYYYHSFRVR